MHGEWRQATRAVMVLLSLHGLPVGRIAVLMGCHPVTVRRWISRFNSEGLAGRPTGPVRVAQAGRAAADRADRWAAGPAGPVDAAAGLAVSGPAAGRRTHAKEDGKGHALITDNIERA
jgi:Homeodomain-like domain-containing protein